MVDIQHQIVEPVQIDDPSIIGVQPALGLIDEAVELTPCLRQRPQQRDGFFQVLRVGDVEPHVDGLG